MHEFGIKRVSVMPKRQRSASAKASAKATAKATVKATAKKRGKKQKELCVPDTRPEHPPPDELIEIDDHVFSDDEKNWTHQTTVHKQPAKSSTKIPYIVRELSTFISLEMRRRSEGHKEQSLEFWRNYVVPIWMMQNCLDEVKQQSMKRLKGEEGQRRSWWNLKKKK